MSIPTLEPQIPGPASTPRTIRGRDLVAGAIGVAAGVTLTLGATLLPAVTSQLALAAESPFKSAVEECSASGVYVLLLDDGAALELNTAGEEAAGADYGDVVCVFNELGMSDTILSRISTTRALDGRQEGNWGAYTASWTYHPDDGLSILIEFDEN